MKNITVFLIILVLLTNCTINNNIKFKNDLFCSSVSNAEKSPYVLKLDSNNTFEIEHLFYDVVYDVGIVHDYCKGKWSYISKRIIILECDKITEWDWNLHPYPELTWNPDSDKEYVKVISENKIILVRGKSKIILKSDRCDCIPEEYLIVGGERYGMP
jgi:hypothetical protein